MYLDYKEEEEVSKVSKEIQLVKEGADFEEEIKECKYNVIGDYDSFYKLKDWRNQLNVIDEIFLNVRNYFSRKGGISFSFMNENNIFPTLFEILIQSKSESPAHFNAAFDIIDQIIFHSRETVDDFVLNDYNIIDQIKDILNPFLDERCLEYNSFIPEMFTEASFNVASINISLNIIFNLCQSNRKLLTLYKENFLIILSNILRMKTSDNQIRELQIIDCLYLILLKSSHESHLPIDDCYIVLQAYLSVFEKFREDQTCINSIAKICKVLSEILKKEENMIFIIFQKGFYEFIPFILEYIFSVQINPYAMLDISYFMFISLSTSDKSENDDIEEEKEKIEESEEEQEAEEKEEEESINTIITAVSNIIGNVHSINILYEYILNITIRRLPDRQHDSPPFTPEEQRTIAYFFEFLDHIIIIKDDPIIEYPRLDELFSVISEFGNFELKTSFCNFIIGIIQVLSVDQLHQFLRLDFLLDFFENYSSSDTEEADLILDTIFDVLRRLGIANEDILNANKDIENIEDNEIILVVRVFPQLLQTFLTYEGENRLKADIVLSRYYKDIDLKS